MKCHRTHVWHSSRVIIWRSIYIYIYIYRNIFAVIGLCLLRVSLSVIYRRMAFLCKEFQIKYSASSGFLSLWHHCLPTPVETCRCSSTLQRYGVGSGFCPLHFGWSINQPRIPIKCNPLMHSELRLISAGLTLVAPPGDVLFIMWHINFRRLNTDSGPVCMNQCKAGAPVILFAFALWIATCMYRSES